MKTNLACLVREVRVPCFVFGLNVEFEQRRREPQHIVSAAVAAARGRRGRVRGRRPGPLPRRCTRRPAAGVVGAQVASTGTAVMVVAVVVVTAMLLLLLHGSHSRCRVVVHGHGRVEEAREAPVAAARHAAAVTADSAAGRVLVVGVVRRRRVALACLQGSRHAGLAGSWQTKVERVDTRAGCCVAS